MTEALVGLAQRKLDKFEAPAETLRRHDAANRGIKHKQFVADADALARGLVPGLQPQRGLKIPLCRAIIASIELRLAEAGPCIGVCRRIAQYPPKYFGGPSRRLRQEK